MAQRTKLKNKENSRIPKKNPIRILLQTCTWLHLLRLRCCFHHRPQRSSILHRYIRQLLYCFGSELPAHHVFLAQPKNKIKTWPTLNRNKILNQKESKTLLKIAENCQIENDIFDNFCTVWDLSRQHEKKVSAQKYVFNSNFTCSYIYQVIKKDMMEGEEDSKIWGHDPPDPSDSGSPSWL